MQWETMQLVSAAQMRELDRLTIERFGVTGRVLMERAGRGAARVLPDLLPGRRVKDRCVVVAAGKGNNGGDGFVVARILRARGARTHVFLFGDSGDVKGDALHNLRMYRRGGHAVRTVTDAVSLHKFVDALADADALVDALFGTGLKRAPRGVVAEAIEAMNAAGVPILAIDIPSGLNAETGCPTGVCVRARATATFGFAKLGHAMFPGVELSGKLHVIHIGIAPRAVAAHPPRAALIEVEEAASLVPVRRPDVHKGDCGHLLVIAGSFGKTGAARLATRGALRAGAGLVTLAVPASQYPIVASGVCEAMTATLPDRDGRVRFDASGLARLVEGKSAVVVGPGLGAHADTRRIVRWLIARAPGPVVLDADALNAVAQDLALLRAARVPLVLTPHPGEMARLSGTSSAGVQADRPGCARALAVRCRVVVVLKGSRTIIADGLDGDDAPFLWINPTGNPGLAAGGTGDVLAGVIGAFAAQGLVPVDAARLGVYLHGAAADRIALSRGQIGMLASDVIDALPAGLHALAEEHSARNSPS